MKIKTFPLQFTDGYLKQIEDKAGKGNIKKFIMQAIEEKMAIDALDKLLHEPEANK